MTISLFDLFKVGVGPSSSHTMGPMTACAMFVEGSEEAGLLASAEHVEIQLYGSLALTGKGHGTDRAVILGLSGYRPGNICPDEAETIVRQVRADRRIRLAGHHAIPFDEPLAIAYRQREKLPFHSNGMRCSLYGARGELVRSRVFYSIGGGAVVTEAEATANVPHGSIDDVPYPFRSGAELLRMAADRKLSIGDLVLANECALLAEDEVRGRIKSIADAMAACIERGMLGAGELPGGLRVERRASNIHRTLLARQERALTDPLSVLDWVNLWALAVNEENAAGGRVVTAPTNGAAGIIPAVLRYYQRFVAGADDRGTATFLLTAAAIGSLFKENASISGAEVGCQGEVGVASSMAAAGLAAVLGGTNEQIENAAEIAMEHNLGLTCDPVGGLVQVPCIERNAVGAVKSIEAARLSLLGDGTHRVSLDQVIETMRLTGADMNERYKETSLGGLAVNVVEC